MVHQWKRWTRCYKIVDATQASRMCLKRIILQLSSPQQTATNFPCALHRHFGLILHTGDTSVAGPAQVTHNHAPSKFIVSIRAANMRRNGHIPVIGTTAKCAQAVTLFSANFYSVGNAYIHNHVYNIYQDTKTDWAVSQVRESKWGCISYCNNKNIKKPSAQKTIEASSLL